MLPVSTDETGGQLNGEVKIQYIVNLKWQINCTEKIESKKSRRNEKRVPC
jgi:hypothetical protein